MFVYFLVIQLDVSFVRVGSLLVDDDYFLLGRRCVAGVDVDDIELD